MHWTGIVLIGGLLCGAASVAEANPTAIPYGTKLPHLLSIIRVDPPSSWRENDGNWEWGLGTGVEASKYASPTTVVFDLTWSQRSRFNCACSAILLGNERGVTFTVAYRGRSHMLTEPGGEIVLSMRPALRVAPIGSRLRGPSYLGLFAPAVGIVVNTKNQIRDAQVSLLSVPITKLVRRGWAVRVEPTINITVPLKAQLKAQTFFGLTISVVSL